VRFKSASVESDVQTTSSYSPSFKRDIEMGLPIAPLTRYSTCGICQEPFRKVVNPVEVSLTASTSEKQPTYGLALPCPGSHEYCLDCMTSYLRSKLDGATSDGGNVFPVRCPECPRTVEWEVKDDVAEKVLGRDLLDVWRHQKVLLSIPRFYCPNPSCSVPIEVPEDTTLTQDRCPACRVSICRSCRSLWHKGLSCTDSKRNKLEDEVDKLANEKHWRRCSKCRVLVERTAGCPHMTCRCGNQFCHWCGSRWVAGECSRPGGCSGSWVNNTPAPRVRQSRTGSVLVKDHPRTPAPPTRGRLVSHRAPPHALPPDGQRRLPLSARFKRVLRRLAGGTR